METGTIPELARAPATGTPAPAQRVGLLPDEPLPDEPYMGKRTQETACAGALTACAQYLLLGAPDPYVLDRHAVRTAVLRRRIVAPLTRYWFGERLSVAGAWSRDWSSDKLKNALCVEQPDSKQIEVAAPASREQWHELAKPLQQRLIESGLTGLLPAAGLGNPFAFARFRSVTSAGKTRWVWVELESRLPALFPPNPFALLFVYLPASLRLGRLLFDDVDIDRLRRYVTHRRAELEASLGPRVVRDMLRDVDRLRFHQNEWKRPSRLERGIRYRRQLGQIGADEALRYETHPLRFYARELLRIPGLVARAAARLSAR